MNVRARAPLGLVAALGVAGTLVLAAPPQTPAAPDATPRAQTPFRAGTNAVLVDTYPTRNGRVVEGLTADQFQLFEDGKPQHIESIEFVRVPPRGAQPEGRDPNSVAEMRQMAADPHLRLVTIYLDPAHTAFSGAIDAHAPVMQFVDRAVGPDDLFGIMTPAMRPSDITFARKAGAIENAISQYSSWGRRGRITTDPSDPMEGQLEYCFQQDSTAALLATVLDRRREDRVLTSLHDLVAYLGQLREARSIVLVITNGWVLYGPDQTLANLAGGDPRIANGGGVPPVLMPGRAATEAETDRGGLSQCLAEVNRVAALDDGNRFRQIIADAKRNNVSFYPLDADGLSEFGVDMDKVPMERGFKGIDKVQQLHTNMVDRQHALIELADNTGGIAVVGTNDLQGGLTRVIDAVSTYYLLTYYSTNDKRDGRFRRIDVKLNVPGVSVRARSGYFATGPATPAAAAPAGAGAALAAEVTAAFGRIDSSSADISTTMRRLAGRMSVVVELGDRTESTTWANGAQVDVEVVTSSGQRVAAGTGRLLAGERSTVVELPLDIPAAAQVRAHLSAGAAVLDGRSDVPAAAAGTPLLADPLVYRATPSPRSPLRPVATFAFRRAERLHADVLLLGPVDHRTVQLLDQRGQPLAVTPTLSDRDVDGRPAIGIDLNLVPLADGEYAIALEAGGGDKSDHKLIAFRVKG
jgi:VWFA-related protein